MLQLYRRTFINLAKLVLELEQSENRANVCLQIQKILIVKIRYVEKKVRHWKKRSKYTHAEIDQQKVNDYQRILGTLKCFGDAIAFLHMDRWDIKALSGNKNAGFISDKEGFNLERRTLTTAAKQGLPSVLVDLTNCLTYGDLFSFMPDIVERKWFAKIHAPFHSCVAFFINPTKIFKLFPQKLLTIGLFCRILLC